MVRRNSTVSRVGLTWGDREPVSARALAQAAKLGWPVFPCDPASKRPLTQTGLKEATRDFGTIQAWWRRWPLAMVGVPTGPAAGFWALDMDRHGGPDGIATIATLGELPDTVEVDTPSGGRHALFASEVARPMANTAGRLPGVDTRGAGGYVIAAGSVRADGAAYTWRNPPPLFAIAPAPDWLYRKLAPSHLRRLLSAPLRVTSRASLVRYVTRAVDAECSELAVHPHGGRNARLFRAACNLGEFIGAGLLPTDLAEDALTRAADACGLLREDGPRVVAATIASGLRRGCANPRRLAV